MRSLIAAAVLLGLTGVIRAQGSPVTLGDQVLFQINWGYGHYTPEFRAKGISNRLWKVAADPLASATVTLVPAELSTDLFAGDVLVVSVFDGDARAANVSRDALARQWAGAIEQSINHYREQHRIRNVVVRWAAAIAILAGCFYLLLRSRRDFIRLNHVISAYVERRAARTSFKLGRLLSSSMISKIVRRLLGIVRLLINLALIYASVHALLLVFPSTRPQAVQILNRLLEASQGFFASVWQSMPSLLFVALVAYVTVYVLRVVRFIFNKVADGELTFEGFHRSWAGTTSRLVAICIVLLAILVAYPYIPGSDSAAFKGLSLFVGLLISLGSSGVVANLLAGVMLTYMDAFAAGDLVKIGHVTGYVDGTSVLTTRIRTYTNRMITIPNSVVLAGEVINYSNLDKTGVCVTSQVGIGYDVPWRQVEGMLRLAASRTSRIRRVPEPFVLVKSLNQFDITYELDAYLESGSRLPLVEAELNRNILDAFNEYGVQIMTPAYHADPNRAVVVPKDRWNAAPAGTPSETEPVISVLDKFRAG